MAKSEEEFFSSAALETSLTVVELEQQMFTCESDGDSLDDRRQVKYVSHSPFSCHLDRQMHEEQLQIRHIRDHYHHRA